MYAVIFKAKLIVCVYQRVEKSEGMIITYSYIYRKLLHGDFGKVTDS